VCFCDEAVGLASATTVCGTFTQLPPVTEPKNFTKAFVITVVCPLLQQSFVVDRCDFKFFLGKISVNQTYKVIQKKVKKQINC
jgi:hypothetical protein